MQVEVINVGKSILGMPPKRVHIGKTSVSLKSKIPERNKEIMLTLDLTHNPDKKGRL